MGKSFKEFASEYAIKIKHASNAEKGKEVQTVLNKIDNIVYENTQKPITDEDKILLLNELLKELKKPLMINGKIICLNEADNKNYLDLINTVLLALKNKDSSKK